MFVALVDTDTTKSTVLGRFFSRIRLNKVWRRVWIWCHAESTAKDSNSPSLSSKITDPTISPLQTYQYIQYNKETRLIELNFPARNFCWGHWKPRVQNWMPHDTMRLHNPLDGSQVTLQALATGNVGNVRNVAFCFLGSHTPSACQPHSCRVMVTSPRISIQHCHMCQRTIWKSETW